MDELISPHYASSASVTIDTQLDTLDGGPLEIPGTSAVLPAMARLCSGFRDAGRPIVHVVRLYRADGSNAEPCRRELVRGTTPLLRPGSPGRKLAPELLPADAPDLDDETLLAGGVQFLSGSEAVIYKPRWGAFYRTPLERHLTKLGIDTLVFAGCNFPNCPRTSIYEASERDYRIVLAADAISGLYKRGTAEMRNIGATVARTSSVVEALTSLSPKLP